MKQYVKPSMEVEEIVVCDVICTSGEPTEPVYGTDNVKAWAWGEINA